MAEDVQELLVQVSPEGVDETTRALEDQEESFTDMADTAEEESGRLADFSDRWQGAMGAVVAGLAVASAGLLSQVPVVGELMSGLFAIIEAIAFQMDQVLRPVLQPVTDAFFGLSNAIFEAEGILGIIIGVLGVLVVVLGAVAAVTFVASGAVAQLTVAYGAASTAANVLTGALGTLATALGISTVAAGLLVGGLLVLAGLSLAALITDFMGIRTALVDLASLVLDINLMIANAFTDLVSSAFGWGVDLMAEFAAGILANATAPIDAVAGVFDQVMGLIGFDLRANDLMAQRWGEDMVMHFGEGMKRGRRDALPDDLLGSDGGGGGGAPAAPGGRQMQLFIDGRQAEKGTRKHRDRQIKRRGRYG